MYSIIDLTNNPPTIVQGTENFTEQECIEWIKMNGDDDIVKYTIKKLE